MSPRWSKSSGEKYGRGPGHVSLNDNRVLQRMTEITLKSAQLQMAPPMAIENNSLISTALDLKPFGQTFFRNINQRPQPIYQPGTLSANQNEAMLSTKRQAIRDAFYYDIILTQDAGTRTATEVMQRTSERTKIFSSILGRMQSEMLEPLIERVFNICLRAGVVPPPPPQLANRSVEVRYRSPLSRAQEAQKVQATQTFLEMMLPIQQNGLDVASVIDVEALSRQTAKRLGVPLDIFKSPEELQQMREAAQQAAQAQQQAQGVDQIAKLSEVARNIGQAEETSSRGGGAVNEMIKQLGEQD